MKKFTDEKIEAIIRSYENGDPKSEISQTHGVSDGHLRKIIKKRGYTPRVYFPRLSPEGIEEILTAYKNGMTRLEISKKFNISVSTVRTLRDKADLPCQVKKVTKEEAKIICMKYKRGDKRAVIALEHNRHESVIRKIAIRAGIPARTIGQRKKAVTN